MMASKHDMLRFALLHEDMIHFFDPFPPNASPMSILSTTVNSLHNYYPDMDNEDAPYGGITVTAAHLLANTRTFALGRLPGWIAQWTEMREDRENTRIGRPRQIYSGNTRREFVMMKDR